MFLLCDIHDMIDSSSFYKSRRSHILSDVFFQSSGKGYFTIDLRQPLGPQYLRLWEACSWEWQAEPTHHHDVLEQCCLQGERWTLMNKYEDNLHLCCTFYSSHSPHGSTEGKERGGKKSQIFKRSLWAIVFVNVHVLVCVFQVRACLFVCVYVYLTISLCVLPSEFVHTH